MVGNYRSRVIAYAARANRLPAPPHIVWGSLTDPQAPGARPWLNLMDDEIEPAVLESAPTSMVVWSSPWPSRPNDQVLIELAAGGMSDTSVRFTLLSPDELPDEGEARRLRKRISYLLFADLRDSYDQ